MKATARACALWRFRVKRAGAAQFHRTGNTSQNNNLVQIRFQRRGLEKDGQLIKCVKNFQAHKNECCDHQIIANLHAEFETDTPCGSCPAGGRPSTKSNLRRRGANLRRTMRRLLKMKRPPPPRRSCLCREPLLERRSLLDASSPCSHTVENLYSPQHDDDGQYQRSRRQYTF